MSRYCVTPLNTHKYVHIYSISQDLYLHLGHVRLQGVQEPTLS